MFYLPCPGHLQWLTHREALHNAAAGEPRSWGYSWEIQSKETTGMPVAPRVQYVCVRMSHSGRTERSKQNNIAISWTGKAFTITWEHGLWKMSLLMRAESRNPTSLHPRRKNEKLPIVSVPTVLFSHLFLWNRYPAWWDISSLREQNGGAVVLASWELSIELFWVS